MSYQDFLIPRLIEIFRDSLTSVYIQLDAETDTVFVRCEPIELQIAEDSQYKLGELMCDFEDAFPGVSLSFVRENNLINFSLNERHTIKPTAPVTVFPQLYTNSYAGLNPLSACEPNVVYRGLNTLLPTSTLELQQVISVVNGSIVLTTELKSFAGIHSSPVTTVQEDDYTYDTNACVTCIAA